MNAPGFPRLLADIGGTNVRFGSQLAPQGAIAHIRSYPCADFKTPQDAVQHHLQQLGLAPPNSCAMGVAAPVAGDQVAVSNSHWAFSIQALQQQLRLAHLLVLNDFEALAMALPALKAPDLHQVGGGVAVAGAPMGLVGPGTGLGVAAMVPVPHSTHMVAVAGEGGHATLAGSGPEQAAVLQHLQGRFGHVSAERALSGPGLENLYLALAQVRGLAGAPARGAAAITTGALQQGDPLCMDTLNLFCSLLGQVAGNLALTLGTRGGLYLGGGIVPRLGAWFERSPFRASFEAKGRFSNYLCAIPTLVLRASAEAALLGACRALDMPGPPLKR